MNLVDAVGDILAERGWAIATPYDVFRHIYLIYKEKKYKGREISLRKDLPDSRDYKRTVDGLFAKNIITVDRDLLNHAFRVNVCPDEPAENVACEADRFVYVSHLSAMQRYGLSSRNPSSLFLTRLSGALWDEAISALVERELGWSDFEGYGYFPKRFEFPHILRGREITVHDTKNPGETLQLRNSPVRITSIGQTFVDTLSRPQWCGGMAHVLTVWEEHAETYLDEIVDAVDRTSSKIIKVRAGYILDEHIQLKNSNILAWLSSAQRGGSRVLDPTKPYKPSYSEKWMISLNVGSEQHN